METSESDNKLQRKTTIKVIKGGQCAGIVGQEGKTIDARTKGGTNGVQRGLKAARMEDTGQPQKAKKEAGVIASAKPQQQAVNNTKGEVKVGDGMKTGGNASPSEKDFRSDGNGNVKLLDDSIGSQVPRVSPIGFDTAQQNKENSKSVSKDDLLYIDERHHSSDKDLTLKAFSTNSLPAKIGEHVPGLYVADKRYTLPEATNISANVRKRNGITNLQGKKTSGELSPDSLVGKGSKKSKKQKAHDTKNIMQAIFVRCLLSVSSLLCVWRAADVMRDDRFWLLGLANVILGIETILIVKFRQGKETIWICPCFVIYLCATVPSIWILQLDKIKRYNEYSDNTNTSFEALSSISGVTLPFALEPDTWVSVLQQSLLFILVIGRMILPRGKLSREQLSQLLFVFIGAGSDVVEFFVVFDEPEFRSNKTLLYASLIVWSASLLQFTLVLTSVKNSKKTRLGQYMVAADRDHKSLFGIEILSLWVSIILMDGPYFCLRLYAMVKFRVLSYGIIFFTCKNVLMLLLLFYRMSIICVKLNSREKRKDMRALAELGKV